MSSSWPAPLSVGDRVQGLDGEKATVRYVGSVDGQEGEWFGVEWDNAERGRHDGELKGRRYFDCVPAGRVAGSFLRAPKIAPRLTVLQALRSKYSPEGEEDGTAPPEGEIIHKVEFELVGTDKIKRTLGTLDALEKVFLPDARIASAGPPGELGAALGALWDLDLTGNLLSGWGEIEAVGREIPKLTQLTLSRMPIAPPPPALGGAAAFAALRVLVLNSTRVSWGAVGGIVARLPALQELHACGNGIASLAMSEAAAEAFAGMQVINLDGNVLEGWGEVEALARLPALRSLSLNDNQIPRVFAPPAGGFAALACLLMGRNQLAAWEDVDALATFPSLTECRVTDNPLTKDNPSHSRFEAIARVSTLLRLNGSPVTEMERRESEVRYLRVVATNAARENGGGSKTAPKAEELSTAMAEAHPRYAELLGKYGEIGLGGGPGPGGVASGTLGDDMLSLTLTCVSVAAGAVGGSVVRKLPGSLAAGTLKMMCEKLFKVQASGMKLFARAPETPMPEPLGDDSYELAYLGVCDGWEILVDEDTP